MCSDVVNFPLEKIELNVKQSGMSKTKLVCLLLCQGCFKGNTLIYFARNVQKMNMSCGKTCLPKPPSW